MEKIVKKYHYSWIVLKELVKADFKLRYEGSALGMIWSALKPLLLFTIMYVVFVHFLKFGQGIPFFPVSLLLGIVLWNFFNEATSQGLRSIVEQGSILRKIAIPKYIIVVSTTVSALINLGINLVVVLIFAVINGVQFQWTAILIIPLIIELFVFSISLAFLFSSLYVRFRDLGHIWDVVLQALFYATPIIYPLSYVTDFSAEAAKVLLLNPMAQIIQDARWAVVYQGTDTVWNMLSNPLLMMIPLLMVAALAVISVISFRRNSRYFAELI